MNRCPQCTTVLSKSERECSACGSLITSDFTATLQQKNFELEIQETQKLNAQSMDTERWKKIKGLFDAVQELEPKKREKFLDNACAADVELRREVENLLNSFENAESFMEQPAAREVASMFEDKKNIGCESNDRRFEQREVCRGNRSGKSVSNYRLAGQRRNGRSFQSRRH